MSVITTTVDKVKAARQYFDSDKTRDYHWRRARLEKLKQVVVANEDNIFKALNSDLNKSVYEAHMSEVGLVIAEIDHAIHHLKSWMRPKRNRVSYTQMPASSHTFSEPYGVVLIMSPWNYPFQLTLTPIIGAIAAGNCAIVKPSAYSAATSAVIVDIVAQAFGDGHVQVVTGGRAENEVLLEQRFDYIFFTGSPAVGRTVMRHAAEHLTPLTLELGGKSPCIVDDTVDIEKTAKRILFGKLLNSGQTCVAPDYVLVDQAIKPALISALKREHQLMISDEAYRRAHYPKIINQKHYQRLKQLLDEQNICYGGTYDDQTRQMAFTIVDQPDCDTPLMQEEIFGPILPIIGYHELYDVIGFIRQREKPLALYLFSNKHKTKEAIVKNISYGGGCINDTIVHITGSNQPFGGVGSSGMGAYHGKYSFDTFSHRKNVVQKWWIFDLPLRYHPYKKPKSKLASLLFKARD